MYKYKTKQNKTKQNKTIFTILSQNIFTLSRYKNIFIYRIMNDNKSIIEIHKTCIIKLINEEFYGSTKIKHLNTLATITTTIELYQWINTNIYIFYKLSHPILYKIIHNINDI